jgi:hypothetical protein
MIKNTRKLAKGILLFGMPKKDIHPNRIAFRVSDAQLQRLKDVQEDVMLHCRGTAIDESRVMRSILFGEEPDLVSLEERAYLRLEIPALHGPFAPKRNKP